MSPDARALRSELTGKVRTTPSRSLINGMLHNELNYPAGTRVDADQGEDPDFVDSYLETETAQGTSAPASQASDDEFIEYEQFEPTDEFENQGEFAEVPTEELSSKSESDSSFKAYEDFEYEQDSAFNDGSFAQGDGFNEIPADDFDQMKSVVTGETTEVAQANDSSSQGTSQPEQGENADPFSESFVSVADGFSGQLIIPLPTGGALRLDWPLGFDYVVGDEDQPESTFTEVPTGGDDFADFTE